MSLPFRLCEHGLLVDIGRTTATNPRNGLPHHHRSSRRRGGLDLDLAMALALVAPQYRYFGILDGQSTVGGSGPIVNGIATFIAHFDDGFWLESTACA
ncbi:hypothetical protein BJ508DRAFT_419001 [Ascobolus immersus RN42]|uniref:Uncharacterized protein n=1 Tax=Ascobolus immersus RN42 TaxID=1160509 RepID=A0A3N4HJN7_ASCIM|nr:hypothetical protein BJ508DRAFT_419001 [Ascobolus immersus RN42]